MSDFAWYCTAPGHWQCDFIGDCKCDNCQTFLMVALTVPALPPFVTLMLFHSQWLWLYFKVTPASKGFWKSEIAYSGKFIPDLVQTLYGCIVHGLDYAFIMLLLSLAIFRGANYIFCLSEYLSMFAFDFSMLFWTGRPIWFIAFLHSSLILTKLKETNYYRLNASLRLNASSFYLIQVAHDKLMVNHCCSCAGLSFFGFNWVWFENVFVVIVFTLYFSLGSQKNLKAVFFLFCF